MKLLMLGSTLAMMLGLGVSLTDPAAAQQIQFECDENSDGVVDATESRLCTDAEFDEIAAGEEVLTEEVLLAITEGKEGAPTFAEIDENGDGQISREEWVGFGERQFTGAAEASGGKMSTEDYRIWREKGMVNIRA